jgi:hypothetical protein
MPATVDCEGGAVDLSVPTMPATVDCEGGAVSWHTASVEQCHATNVSLWKVTALMHEINYMYYHRKDDQTRKQTRRLGIAK